MCCLVYEFEVGTPTFDKINFINKLDSVKDVLKLIEDSYTHLLMNVAPIRLSEQSIPESEFTDIPNAVGWMIPFKDEFNELKSLVCIEVPTEE